VTYHIHEGDCVAHMAMLPSDFIDAIICDPPYELGFMGKKWDSSGVALDVATWAAALRIAKPGAHLLAFGGTRTFHRLACAIEDAGWEIRDCIMWVYGSGFPKSLDVSKAIDKAAGLKRPRVPGGCNSKVTISTDGLKPGEAISDAAISDAARQWSGFGTSLKPAYEPIIVARKPLIGTVAANVLEHGTGALNVDGCRVGTTVETWPAARNYAPGQKQPGGKGPRMATGPIPAGRWPANLIHDGSAEVLEGFPETGAASQSRRGAPPHYNGERMEDLAPRGHNDAGGSAARFFYCAKASKKERNGSKHPTIKPLKLMKYLCKLAAPPGGLILDPFTGSGTTGAAAVCCGFTFLGIEKDAQYCADASKRIAASVLV